MYTNNEILIIYTIEFKSFRLISHKSSLSLLMKTTINILIIPMDLMIHYSVFLLETPLSIFKQGC